MTLLFLTNLTVSGTLQSPITSLQGISSCNLESNKADKLLFGTSISNVNNTGSINYGVSISNTDAKVGKLIGVTTPNYLQRNEIVLPSTFTNSSLTSVGTLGTLLCVTGKFNSTGGFSNFNYNTAPLVLGDTRPTYFMKRNSADDQYNTLDIYNWNSIYTSAHLITLGYNTNCVGIAGITAPNYKLDVRGDCNVSSGQCI